MASDILISPDNSGIPQILFVGSGINDTPITLNVVSDYDSANGSGSALIFEGTEGQLFSVTDNLSSGTIFKVGDIGGLPLIEANASGDVQLGEYGRYVGIGTGVSEYQCDVFGTGRFSDSVKFGDNTTQTTAYTGESVSPFSYTYLTCIWAEENGVLNDNAYEWAFGNGASTPNDGGLEIFVPPGETCNVVAMALVQQDNAADFNVELVINGTPQGASCRVVGTSTRTAMNTSVSATINNGDIINFYTNSENGTAAPNTVMVYLQNTVSGGLP
jgi:hypothetical protein